MHDLTDQVTVIWLQARDYFRAYRARKKDEREAIREEPNPDSQIFLNKKSPEGKPTRKRTSLCGDGNDAFEGSIKLHSSPSRSSQWVKYFCHQPHFTHLFQATSCNLFCSPHLAPPTLDLHVTSFFLQQQQVDHPSMARPQRSSPANLKMARLHIVA